MNRLVGLCVLVSTAVGVVVHRREITEAWRGAVAMLPHPPLPSVTCVAVPEGPPLPAALLREVMDITRRDP